MQGVKDEAARSENDVKPVHGMWLYARLAWNVFVVVAAFVFVVWMGDNERSGRGMSTRMHSEHIHRGVSTGVLSAYSGYMVGFTQPEVSAFTRVKLITTDDVKNFYRGDKMCDLSIAACNHSSTASKCLCTEWAKAGEEYDNCVDGTEPMDAVVHAGDTHNVAMHFRSQQDLQLCRISYMDDVIITTNESAGMLCTHAPQLLGMVLGLLFFFWGVHSLLHLRKEWMQPAMHALHGDLDEHMQALKTEKMYVKQVETLVLAFVVILWLVEYLIISSTRAEEIQDPNAATEKWKFHAMFVEGTTVTMKDDVAQHYRRSEAWGSWVYGVVVLALWGLTNVAGYTFNFSNVTDRLRAMAARKTDEAEMVPSATAPLMGDLDDEPPRGQPLAEAVSWNLSSFGTDAPKKSSYSLLVHNSQVHHRSSVAPVEWNDASPNQQTAVYKQLILLTVVLLNISMYNRYVMDVNLWSIVFVVAGYGLLDVFTRRTNELLRVMVQLGGMQYNWWYVLALGTLFKAILFLLGSIWLWWENYMSTQYSALLVSESVDGASPTLAEEPLWYHDYMSLSSSTIVVWGLVFLVDFFADFQYAVPKKQEFSHKTTARAQGAIYFIMVTHTIFFVFPALVYSPAATQWKEFRTPSIGEDSFSAYEWNRNNWMYSITRQ